MIPKEGEAPALPAGPLHANSPRATGPVPGGGCPTGAAIQAKVAADSMQTSFPGAGIPRVGHPDGPSGLRDIGTVALTATSESPFLLPIEVFTMSDKIDATAKDAEGKMEADYGELTGDKGHQIQGKAKQVQAAAMNAAEDIKEGARKAAQKLSDAAGDLADKIS